MTSSAAAIYVSDMFWLLCSAQLSSSFFLIHHSRLAPPPFFMLCCAGIHQGVLGRQGYRTARHATFLYLFFLVLRLSYHYSNFLPIVHDDFT